jgi:hypothetical protein
LHIINIVFQDTPQSESIRNLQQGSKRAIIHLDMGNDANISTSAIPSLVKKMETALPGILEAPAEELQHICGLAATDAHDFKEEIIEGTGLCHLLEHLIIYMLGRRMGRCAGFSGQRSQDIETGLKTHHYLVVEYANKLEAVVAIDLAFQMVNAWLHNKTIRLNRDTLITGVQKRLALMLPPYESNLMQGNGNTHQLKPSHTA